MAPGRYFKEWMSEQLAASPLARELGKTELTFADAKRRDLPGGVRKIDPCTGHGASFERFAGETECAHPTRPMPAQGTTRSREKGGTAAGSESLVEPAAAS